VPPTLASFLTLGFISWLFYRDHKEKPQVSAALWLPFIWLGINMSRYLSVWLTMFNIPLPGGSSAEEGTPVDAVLYLFLVIGGIYVLNKRQVGLPDLMQRNVWITLFLVYCFLSIAWSDFPFAAFKRWIKTLGHPLMALIVLTEVDRKLAVITLLKRVAYVIGPVSVLFIKYYPEWGRTYSEWSGEAMYGGITLGKNALGADCFVLGFFFTWHILTLLREKKSKARRNALLLSGGFLYMLWWLLLMANSKTSFMSLLVGTGLLIFAGFSWVNKRLIGVYLVSIAALMLTAELTVGVYERTIRALGRDPTLTDRTYLWEDVLEMQSNPLLGEGFESFWMGERREKLWVKHTWRPNQAHNGYIETYLTLGLAGCALLAGMIWSTYFKCRRDLLESFDFGRLRLGFFVAVVFYNWTEASFKALHPVWTMFYIIALNVTTPEQERIAQEAEEMEKQTGEPAEMAESFAARQFLPSAGGKAGQSEFVAG